MKKKQYKYLICYGYNQKIPSGNEKYPYYNQGGTGRTIVYLDRKIKSEDDVSYLDDILMDKLKDIMEHLETAITYSFKLLK